MPDPTADDLLRLLGDALRADRLGSPRPRTLQALRDGFELVAGRPPTDDEEVLAEVGPQTVRALATIQAPAR